MKFWLLAGVFAVSTALLTPIAAPAANQCGAVFAEAQTALNYWKQTLIEAHQSGNEKANLYAAVKFTLEANPQLNSHEKAALKRMALDLELDSLADQARSQNRSDVLTKVSAFLGISHLFQNNIHGVQPRSGARHRARALLTSTRDALWTIGPTAFALARFQPYQHDPYPEVKLALNKASWAHPEVSSAFDPLFSRSRSPIPKRIGSVRNSWYVGRAILPIIASLSTYVSHNIAPERAIIQHVQTEVLPPSQRPYLAPDFMRDVNRIVGSDIANSKVLIVYSSNLFAKIDSRTRAPLGVPALENFGNADLMRIDNTNELTRVDLSKYDNVIIVAHGQPDSLSVGFNAPAQKMKQGANLILLSCLIGQRGGPAENWVDFSRSMLNGGKSFVSTQYLYTNLSSEAAGPSTAPLRERANVLADQAMKITLEETGAMPLIQLATNGQQALANDHYFDVGVRVFDSSTGETEYIPSYRNDRAQ